MMRQSPESYEWDPRKGVLPDLFTHGAIMRSRPGPVQRQRQWLTEK
jgi:hypothetical protein